jgi:threonine dehydratase
MISGKLDDLRGKRVVLLLCGGNIDPTILSRVIEHGLVVDGRLTQFRAVISDRPGGLAELTQAIASVGASIKEIDHERAFSGANVFTVQVLVTVETHDFDHVRRLHEALTKQGITIISKT